MILIAHKSVAMHSGIYIPPQCTPAQLTITPQEIKKFKFFIDVVDKDLGPAGRNKQDAESRLPNLLSGYLDKFDDASRCQLVNTPNHQGIYIIEPIIRYGSTNLLKNTITLYLVACGAGITTLCSNNHPENSDFRGIIYDRIKYDGVSDEERQALLSLVCYRNDLARERDKNA